MTDSLAQKIRENAEQLSETLKQKGLVLATAESCTGGMISAAITDITGSSAIFHYGFVTYSNEAKTKLLGVHADTLTKFGAVSHQVAKDMALGAIEHSNANVAISCTGIAGPDGGSAEKPVGLVYLGFYIKKKSDLIVIKCNFDGSRKGIRQLTTLFAIQKMQELLL